MLIPILNGDSDVLGVLEVKFYIQISYLDYNYSDDEEYIIFILKNILQLRIENL